MKLINYSTPATKNYIKYAIKILVECGVELTELQREHIRSLKTEESVDNYKIKLLRDSLGVK